MIGWHFATCMLSTIDDGVRGYQPDYYGEGQSGGEPCESVMPYGLIGRPRDPDVSADGTQPIKGAGLMYFRDGARGGAYPTADPRDLAKIPPEKKGSAGQYCAAGGFHLLDGDNGSWQLHVPYEDAEGATAMAIAVDVSDPAAATIQLAHGAGMNVVLDGADKSVKIFSANGSNWLKITNDAVEVAGNLKLTGAIIAGNVVAPKPVALAPEIAVWAAAVVAACAAAPGGPITIPPLPPTFAAVFTQAG